jgi:biopolymer transport protein ExbD
MPTRFIKPQWRPSTALRRSRLHIAIDVSAFLSIMFFLVFLHLRLTSIPDRTLHSGPDLPRSSHSALEPAALREDAMTLVIARDGTLYFRNAKTSPTALPDAIRDALGTGAEKTVYVLADSRAKYADVKAAVDRIGEAGITNVTFLSEEIPPLAPAAKPSSLRP